MALEAGCTLLLPGVKTGRAYHPPLTAGLCQPSRLDLSIHCNGSTGRLISYLTAESDAAHHIVRHDTITYSTAPVRVWPMPVPASTLLAFLALLPAKVILSIIEYATGMTKRVKIADIRTPPI